jgi:hypothetical protein
VVSMAMGTRTGQAPLSLEQRELPPFEMHG